MRTPSLSWMGESPCPIAPRHTHCPESTYVDPLYALDGRWEPEKPKIQFVAITDATKIEVRCPLFFPAM